MLAIRIEGTDRGYGRVRQTAQFKAETANFRLGVIADAIATLEELQELVAAQVLAQRRSLVEPAL